MCDQTHHDVRDSACDWRRQEANGGLNSRDLLDVLEEKSQESLDRVEYTPYHEDADADGGKDTVAP